MTSHGSQPATPRIENHPAFSVTGRSTWISGQHNEEFALAWHEAQRTGFVTQLRQDAVPDGVTRGAMLGVSCVEADPSNRAFTFLVAVETNDDGARHVDASHASDGGASREGREHRTVPAATWAIITAAEATPEALVAAELEMFGRWLPASGYVHAHAPELEVYRTDGAIEFWLPVEPVSLERPPEPGRSRSSVPPLALPKRSTPVAESARVARLPSAPPQRPRR